MNPDTIKIGMAVQWDGRIGTSGRAIRGDVHAISDDGLHIKVIAWGQDVGWSEGCRWQTWHTSEVSEYVRKPADDAMRQKGLSEGIPE